MSLFTKLCLAIYVQLAFSSSLFAGDVVYLADKSDTVMKAAFEIYKSNQKTKASFSNFKKERSNQEMVVLEQDGKIVAYASYKILQEPGRTTVVLGQFIVRKELQSRGHGRDLMAGLVKITGRQYNTISSYINVLLPEAPDSFAVALFIRRLGFTKIPTEYGKGMYHQCSGDKIVAAVSERYFSFFPGGSYKNRPGKAKSLRYEIFPVKNLPAVVKTSSAPEQTRRPNPYLEPQVQPKKTFTEKADAIFEEIHHSPAAIYAAPLLLCYSYIRFFTSDD